MSHPVIVPAVHYPPPSGAVDARGDRAVEAIVGVLILAGFVFRFPLMLPILAVLLGAGAIAGPRANVFQVGFARLIAPRLRASATDAEVAAETVRAQDALVAALCVIAALVYLVVSGLGWFVALVAAIVAIVAATTGVHVGERLLRRFL